MANCELSWEVALCGGGGPAYEYTGGCNVVGFQIVEIALNTAKDTSVREGSFEAVFPNFPPCIGVCYRTCLFDAALSLFSFLPLAPQDDIE